MGPTDWVRGGRRDATSLRMVNGGRRGCLLLSFLVLVTGEAMYVHEF